MLVNFLSHATPDLDWATILKTHLTFEFPPSQVFVALLDPRYGVSVDLKILNALRASDSVIVLWSKKAAERKAVLAEISESVIQRKLIIPVLLEADAPPLPPSIADREWISFASNAKEALARLKRWIIELAESKRRREEREATARRVCLFGLGSLAAVALFQAACSDDEDEDE